MNTSLIDLFLFLIADPYKAKFTLSRFSDPDMKFKDTFQHFIDDYRSITNHDREENKKNIKPR